MSAALRCAHGDLPVLAGGLLLPLRGVWTASVTCHRPDGAAALHELDAADLVFRREDGGADVFVGAVRRSAVDAGRQILTATIAGGAARLLRELPPRDHAPGTAEIPAGLVARGICDDAGERLADGVEVALDARTVPRWTRFASTGRDALDLLADALGLGWRLLPSGRVWLGTETWPDLDDGKRLRRDPNDGTETWACDGAPLRPGATLARRRVVEVRYALGGALRATVRASVAGDPPRVPDLTLYRAAYSARVVAQDAAGLLEVIPDDPRLGDEEHPLRRVPLRLGLPGCAVTVPAGTRVRVSFEHADPRRAYATGVDADPGATSPLALVGDAVRCGSLSAVVPGVGACVLTWTDASGQVTSGPLITIGGVVDGPGHALVKGRSG